MPLLDEKALSLIKSRVNVTISSPEGEIGKFVGGRRGKCDLTSTLDALISKGFLKNLRNTKGNP
jgi:hypothetical protein